MLPRIHRWPDPGISQGGTMFELWLFDLLGISYLSSGPGYDLWCDVKSASMGMWDRWRMEGPLIVIDRTASYNLLPDGRFELGA